MACIGYDLCVMASIAMAYAVTAYTVITYIVMACIATAYIAMAYVGYGLYTVDYGPCSYGLYRLWPI